LTITAELHEGIRVTIPSIVECLKASEWSVRNVAIEGLLSIAAHGTYMPPMRPFPFGVLSYDYS
jgi:hypothetical protein